VSRSVIAVRHSAITPFCSRSSPWQASISLGNASASYMSASRTARCVLQDQINAHRKDNCMANARRLRSTCATESLASSRCLESYSAEDHRQLCRVDAHSLHAIAGGHDFECSLLQSLDPEHEAVAIPPQRVVSCLRHLQAARLSLPSGRLVVDQPHVKRRPAVGGTTFGPPRP
jgi:hypothetical protein